MGKIIRATELLLKPPSPKDIIRVTFAVTYRCNSKCIICNIWERGNDEDKAELSIDEIKSFFSNNPLLKSLKKINITGGEPFIRKDLAEMTIFFLKEFRSVDIDLQTNGLSTSLIVNTIKTILEQTESSKLNLSISLDALGPLNDEIRGIKGAYDRTIKTIEALIGFKERLNLSISFTLTPLNFREIEKVKEYAESLGMGFFLQFVQQSSIYFVNRDKEFLWDNEKLNEVFRVLSRLTEDASMEKGIQKKLSAARNRFFLEKSIEYQKKPRRMIPCFSGSHSLFLDPLGNVYPCIMLDKCFGNIRENDFSRFWLEEEAEKVRTFIKENRCHCWMQCEAHLNIQRSLKSIIGMIKK
ncbi:MAG: radical SAM protein [Candidatus Coatesbacteria bacterium]|nr:radical SAM protein [Candidatus Coatesbacteria bacterium]